MKQQIRSNNTPARSLFAFSGVEVELPLEIERSVLKLSNAPSENRGAVFTKREIVDFILDLAGYTTDLPLSNSRILEPSFGDGHFLLPIVDRLLETVPMKQRRDSKTIERLSGSITAVELHRDSFASTKVKIVGKLVEQGFSQSDSGVLSDSWLIQGDYLLKDLPEPFDFVVGNPPYLRQEKIPEVLLQEYRRRFKSIYDRADLYIPFIEHSLRSLNRGGKLCFICADRWMKNRYGGPLRKIVSESFHLAAYASIIGVAAFHDDVTAYPAITLIANETPAATNIATIRSIDVTRLAKLADELTQISHSASSDVRILRNVVQGSDAWLLEPSNGLNLVRRLEAMFPLLEEAGCKVGIGVATGADRAFIAPYDSLDVEDSRKLRLAMTDDITSGRVDWRGQGVVNPFEDDGSLANLDRHPRFKKHLLDNYEIISGRHVAKKTPANWYRTIDRIYPELASKPKLLIPDIKGTANIVYENGELYPHHNLYYVTSDIWDLRALRTVLLSGIANLFVSSYTTKMRGGYFRFQAQYLRKIRLPFWEMIPTDSRQLLIDCSDSQDFKLAEEAIARMFELNKCEMAELGWGTKGIGNGSERSHELGEVFSL